jgi:hypothetical protein
VIFSFSTQPKQKTRFSQLQWPINSPMIRSQSLRKPSAYSTRTAMVSFLRSLLLYFFFHFLDLAIHILACFIFRKFLGFLPSLTFLCRSVDWFVKFLLILGRVRNGSWDSRFSVKPFWIFLCIYVILGMRNFELDLLIYYTFETLLMHFSAILMANKKLIHLCAVVDTWTLLILD